VTFVKLLGVALTVVTSVTLRRRGDGGLSLVASDEGREDDTGGELGSGSDGGGVTDRVGK
jgi:hypothetical protein